MGCNSNDARRDIQGKYKPIGKLLLRFAKKNCDQILLFLKRYFNIIIPGFCTMYFCKLLNWVRITEKTLVPK